MSPIDGGITPVDAAPRRARLGRRSSSAATPSSSAVRWPRTSSGLRRAVDEGSRPVRFADLVAVYVEIEATTKRLEMRDPARRAASGTVPRARNSPRSSTCRRDCCAPEYEGIELGMADSLARRAVAIALGRPEEEVAAPSLRASGDLGTTAEELGRGRAPDHGPRAARGRSAIRGAPRDRSRDAGEGSQEAKIQLLAGLLARCSPGGGPVPWSDSCSGAFGSASVR